MAENQPMPDRRNSQVRDKNPNWRGGRVIASNGYVLIRVGTDHHLADVRGYAYEHRLAAEEKIGRRLLPGEIVHHIDENRQNNAPENLEVVFGNAEHFVHHRTEDRGLRMPGEPNPLIKCECGCGEKINKFDDCGRPRKYISGHNPQRTPVEDAVVEEFRQHGTLLTREILGNLSHAQFGFDRASVFRAIRRLCSGEIIKKIGHGTYARGGMFEHG